MIPVFIGYDRREALAWHVLAHSIIRRTRSSLSFTPIGNDTLPPSLWRRPRGPKDSTDFSNVRFMVPVLMQYRGWAVFMDSDMLCFADIEELWQQTDHNYAVMVVKHQHEPTEAKKFLGQEQTQYRRKNWSSLMLFNCGHPACRSLTPEYVNTAPGLDLHGFAWCPDPHAIGEIRGQWNVLATGAERLAHPEIC